MMLAITRRAKSRATVRGRQIGLLPIAQRHPHAQPLGQQPSVRRSITA